MREGDAVAGDLVTEERGLPVCFAFEAMVEGAVGDLRFHALCGMLASAVEGYGSLSVAWWKSSLRFFLPSAVKRTAKGLAIFLLRPILRGG
jgi:hypothetical protein